MDLREYQEFTATTAIYPPDFAIEYLSNALNEEAGEVAGKVAKVIRDQGIKRGQTLLDVFAEKPELIEPILKEMGDVLWDLTRLCFHFGIDLSILAQINYDKLIERKHKGAIGGSGDKR